MTDITTNYKLLNTNEEEYDDGEDREMMIPTVGKKGPAKLYPGERRCRELLSSVGPPKGSVLLPTGGNALQAVDKRLLTLKEKEETILSVVVPNNVEPGDAMLVRCPLLNRGGLEERLVSVVVPQGALPGHAFLVRVPPPPVVVTGVPVTHKTTNGDNNLPHGQPPTTTTTTPTVMGHDILLGRTTALQDLHLTEEPLPAERPAGNSLDGDDDGFEMVPNRIADDQTRQQQDRSGGDLV